jgi:hypothetical protein
MAICLVGSTYLGQQSLVTPTIGCDDFPYVPWFTCIYCVGRNGDLPYIALRLSAQYERL